MQNLKFLYPVQLLLLLMLAVTPSLAANPSYCGRNDQRSQNFGSITQRGYVNNASCTWRINRSGLITLVLRPFNIEEHHDKLIITHFNYLYQVRPNPLIFTGNYGKMEQRVTLSGPVRIEFTSDSSVTGTGFTINYNVTPQNYDKNPVVTVKSIGNNYDEHLIITNEARARYANYNMNVTWVIQVQSHQTLRLSYDNPELLGARELLQIYESNSNSAEVNRYQLIKDVYQIGNYSQPRNSWQYTFRKTVTITFETDEYGARAHRQGGFILKYNFINPYGYSPSDYEIESTNKPIGYDFDSTTESSLEKDENDEKCIKKELFCAAHLYGRAILSIISSISCGVIICQRPTRYPYHHYSPTDVINRNSIPMSMKIIKNRHEKLQVTVISDSECETVHHSCWIKSSASEHQLKLSKSISKSYTKASHCRVKVYSNFSIPFTCNGCHHILDLSIICFMMEVNVTENHKIYWLLDTSFVSHEFGAAPEREKTPTKPNKLFSTITHFAAAAVAAVVAAAAAALIIYFWQRKKNDFGTGTLNSVIFHEEKCSIIDDN